MGLLDRLFKPTPARFADQLIRGLRAAGLQDEIRYEPAEFRIVRSRKGAMVGLSHLGNMYQTFLGKPPAERPAYIKLLVRALLADARTLPEDFESARPDLRAKFWHRASVEKLRLRVLTQEGKDNAIDLPGEWFGTHLLACPVFDWPEASQSINAETLEKWGVTVYEALEAARENLAATLQGYMKIGDGLYVFASGDSYDAARLVLTDRIRDLEVQGQHVAMVPNRDHLLVTGSEDETGLTIMVELAEKQLSEPYTVSAVPLILDEDGWRDWLPPSDHPLYRKLRDMETKWIGPEYAEQTELLNALHQKQGVDLFVASFSAVQKKDGSLVSYCVWGDGVDSLLPVTQKVVIMRQGQEGFAALGDWERVREVAGDLMEPTDHYPPRFRVRQIPDPPALEEIGVGEL